MCELCLFPLFLENDLLKVDKILGFLTGGNLVPRALFPGFGKSQGKGSWGLGWRAGKGTRPAQRHYGKHQKIFHKSWNKELLRNFVSWFTFLWQFLFFFGQSEGKLIVGPSSHSRASFCCRLTQRISLPLALRAREKIWARLVSKCSVVRKF